MITLASLLQSTATPAPDSAWLIAGFALFGAALVLFALEFIIPSAGALATLCVLTIAAGVICFFVHSTMWGFASLAVSLGGAPFVIGYGLQLWSGTPMARRAVLGAQVRGPDVDASALPANGATGTARTALRPVGRVTIAEQPFEAIAEDGFVEAGEPVQVVGREGGALRVRRIASA